MVGLQQGNMKHIMDLHGICKLDLECHIIDFLHNGEWIKFLITSFFKRSCHFDILLPDLELVFIFEAWLFLVMFINIFIVLPLCIFKIKHMSCLNVYQPTY
jgi:hypothetical protein